MVEKLTLTKFVFDSGRPLRECPDGQSLSELLRAFSMQVLEELDRSQIVLVAGESGLGKTELFLSSLDKVKAGGIVELLNEEGKSYRVINAQMHASARDEIEDLLVDQEAKPEVVLIDEVGVMTYSKEMKFELIKRLMDDGRKIVLVCGGSANPMEHFEYVKQELEQVGVNLEEKQMFEYPPLLLNQQQSMEILIALDENVSPIIAKQYIEQLEQQNIPRLFRVLFQSRSLVLDHDAKLRQLMQYVLAHVQIG